MFPAGGFGSERDDISKDDVNCRDRSGAGEELRLLLLLRRFSELADVTFMLLRASSPAALKALLSACWVPPLLPPTATVLLVLAIDEMLKPDDPKLPLKPAIPAEFIAAPPL